MQVRKYSSISNLLLLISCWSICNYYIARCTYTCKTQGESICVCPKKKGFLTNDTLEEALKWSKGRPNATIILCPGRSYNTSGASTIENVVIVAVNSACCDDMSVPADININSDTKLINHSKFWNINLVVQQNCTLNVDCAEFNATHMMLTNGSNIFITSSYFKNAVNGSLSIKNTTVEIRNSYFKNNKNSKINGLGGGAIFMDNKDGSNVTVSNCTFENNSANRAGGTFYLRSGYLNLNVVNISGPETNSVVGDIIYCVFVKNTAITMKNVIIDVSKNIIPNNHVIYCISIEDNDDFKQNVVVNESFQLTCPKYHKVTLPNEKAMKSTLIVSCDVCKTEYKYNPSSIKWNVTNRSFTLYGGAGCDKCPDGANCSDGNLVSRDNYWGYDDGNTSYKFILCPTYYCCSKYNKICSDIDTCAENRMGKICGKCNNQYTLNLFDERCILKVNPAVIRMNLRLFIKCLILGGFSFVVILLYLKEIIGFIKYILLGNVKSKLSRFRSMTIFPPPTSANNANNNGRQYDVDVDDDNLFNNTSNENVEIQDGNEMPTQHSQDVQNNTSTTDNTGNLYTDISATSNSIDNPVTTVLTQRRMSANTYSQNADTTTSLLEHSSRRANIYSVVDQVEDEKSHASGVVKVILFFYQAASIIRIPASAKSDVIKNQKGLKGNYLLIDAITALFNIRFDFQTSSISFHVSSDLNPQSKELFKLSALISIFIIIFIFAIINKLYNIINKLYDRRQETERNNPQGYGALCDRENSSCGSRGAEYKRTEREYPNVSSRYEARDGYESIEGDIFDDKTMFRGREIDCHVKTFKRTPFTVRLMGALLQALIFSFSTISLSTLTLVHCVDLEITNKTTHKTKIKTLLYINGENCYTPFREFLWTFNVVWVFPFPIVLYLSCNMLRRCEIRPWLFLVVIFVPPLFLVCFLRQRQLGNSARIIMTTYDAKTSKYLLTILDGPFKEYNKFNSQSRRRINWEPVLITRRLLLVISVAFIDTPIVKMFPSGLLIWAYLIHHSYQQPYKNKVLNEIEMLSLSLLLILVLINMYWAFTIQFMIHTDIGLFLLILEIVILTLPFTTMFLTFCYKSIKLFCCSFMGRRPPQASS